MHPEHPWRQRAIGALACLSLICVLLGGTAPFIGDIGALGVIARINDSLAPGFLAAGGALALGVALLGAVRWAAVLALAGLVALASLLFPFLGQARALTPAERPVLRLIWFNVLHENAANAGRIADAVIAAAPDIVVFSEASALAEVAPRLEAAFPYRLPCRGPCEILLMSRKPFRNGQLRTLGRFSPQRYARVDFDEAGLTLVATHLVKPWFQGFAEEERETLTSRLAKIEGPVVTVGDFNAAPWSRTMTGIFRQTGLHPPRRPVGTWPAALGALGLPIDHVLVRGGARLTRLEPFGAGLGSNHRGLLAEIALPGG